MNVVFLSIAKQELSFFKLITLGKQEGALIKERRERIRDSRGRGDKFADLSF